jgi:hypothetical protein
MEGFSQVCVWPGTTVGKDKIEEFEHFMLDQFGVRVKYIEEITTAPDQDKDGNPIEGTGGRNDLFFYVHDDDIGKFAVPRLAVGIRWIEDVLAPGNYRSKIYPKRVFKYKIW